MPPKDPKDNEDISKEYVDTQLKLQSDYTNKISELELKQLYDTTLMAKWMEKPKGPEYLKSRCVVCAKHLVLYTNPWQSKDSITGRQIRCEECGLVYFKEPPLKDEEYD